jgi:hypothetical protein
VLFLITAILFFFYKKSLHISLKKMGQALVGFCIGILPFILHDLTHKFIQTGGLVLWTLNRIRLFFGLGSADKITTGKAPHAAYTIWVNIEKIIFPFNQYIVFIILVLILIAITLNKKKLIPKSIPYGLLITLLWLAIPVIGYFVHAAPGPAYFPLIFPPFALLTGFMFYEIINRFKILSLFFIVLIALNAGQTVRNQYFLSTEEMMRTMPPDDYSLGYAMYLQDDIAKFLLKDSQNKPVRLQMGGSAGNFQTSIDSYTYLFLWHGGTIDQKSRIMYELFESKKEIPSGLTIVYQKGGIYVTKK